VPNILLIAVHGLVRGPIGLVLMQQRVCALCQVTAVLTPLQVQQVCLNSLSIAAARPLLSSAVLDAVCQLVNNVKDVRTFVRMLTWMLTCPLDTTRVTAGETCAATVGNTDVGNQLPQFLYSPHWRRNVWTI
jgi:hypothetical protein